MSHFDLSPLYRTTVGFDRLVSLLDSMGRVENDGGGYPPYNIERLAENAYRITMAVAGFSADELDVQVKESQLTVRGQKAPEAEERTYLHRGIAARNFERRFQLADYVEVRGAELRDGLLHIDLVRELPERMKPRKVEINAGNSGSGTVIEGDKA